MQLICPVPRDHDIIPLIRREIREFYFGFLPNFWKKNFSIFCSINRRYSRKEQIESEHTATTILRVCQKNACRCYLALNAPLYQTEHIDRILDFLGTLKSAGLSGVIVADIGLLVAIRNYLGKFELHASCGTVCLNDRSIAFFHKLGVQRIILPRSTTFREIKALVKQKPAILFEAFALPETCTNIDGLCTHWHGENTALSACLSEDRFLGFEAKKKRQDIYKRFHLLSRLGIDIVKIPREGFTTKQFLNKYEDVFRAIRL